VIKTAKRARATTCFISNYTNLNWNQHILGSCDVKTKQYRLELNQNSQLGLVCVLSEENRIFLNF